MDFKDLKEQYENEEITITQLGEGMAKRLRDFAGLHLRTKSDEDYKYDLEQIADQFECCDDEENFDDTLNDLYDWGDTEYSESGSIMKNRLCWIGFGF